MPRSDDLHSLPPDLPVPVDDGACDHLPGMEWPGVELPSTRDRLVSLRDVDAAWLVVYFYPRTGLPDQDPPGGLAAWDAIPGSRGCTPQACSYRDHHSELRELGVEVFGVSTQTSDYQREAATRLHLPFELLSDERLALASALRLPTFSMAGQVLIKRLTLIGRAGRIETCFYPVFPPDADADRVLRYVSGARALANSSKRRRRGPRAHPPPPACRTAGGELIMGRTSTTRALVFLAALLALHQRQSRWRCRDRARHQRRGSQGRSDHRGRDRGHEPRLRARRHRRQRRRGGGRPRGPGAAAAAARRRAARDRARRRHQPAQRRRQGQPVLPARHEPRPRHRLPHHRRRRPAQPADPCARPGLRRPQLPHPGARRHAALPQGSLRRRGRRLLRRRFGAPRLRARSAGAGPRVVGRRARLWARAGRRLARIPRRRPPRRARGRALRRPVGARRRPATTQRRRALQPGRLRPRLAAHRHRLPRPVVRHRSDPRLRRRRRTARPLRQSRLRARAASRGA